MQLNKKNIKIIDNFLKKKDFNKLSNLKVSIKSKNDIKVLHNKIDKNNYIQTSVIERNFLINLQKSYHKKAISILKKLCPKKLNLYDYSEFHIVKTGANFKFPIHDDTPDKLLSGVIYLNPSINKGTIFYKGINKKEKKTIKWKINRAVFFSRKEKETWHSYEGDGKKNRLALVYNLMTYNLKKVYEIEKKNYWLGMLRFKLNPHIFRFFNKII